MAAKRRLDDVLKKRAEIKAQKKPAADQTPPESQTAAFSEFCKNKLEPVITAEIERFLGNCEEGGV